MTFVNVASFRHVPRTCALSLVIAVCACSSSQTPPIPHSASFGSTLLDGQTQTFQHVVIVVQENRTTDNLFNGLPGADTVRSGLNSHGQMVPFVPVSLSATYGLSHRHDAFVKSYDGGKMDGFDTVHSNCSGKCPPEDTRAYAYVKPSQTRPYFAMAEQYAFADRMFQSNEGPSFPAHLYLVAGTSSPQRGSDLWIAENPLTPRGGTTGGCDSPAGSLVALIAPDGRERAHTFPCIDRPSIFGLLDAKHLDWRYYQAHEGSGLWNAADAFSQIRNGPRYATSVIYPPSRFISDVRARKLAAVTFVTPTAANSDHAQITERTGPSWVASVVNAVGTSPYWQSTAIFVTWDDWGGWYDHVKPTHYDSYSLGFRVPLIVISPFTPKGYVSHQQHEFGSILKFLERNFGLESLETTDLRADDLSDCFDFRAPPRRFTRIPAPRTAADFLREPVSQADPDDY